MAGPQFVRYFAPLLNALKELGDSGTPPEVSDLIARALKLSDAKRNEQIASGVTRFENQVAWARFYLSKAGYIDASKRGVWSLTEKGRSATLTDSEAYELYQVIHSQFKGKTSTRADDLIAGAEQPAPMDSALSGVASYRTDLLQVIRGLPPAGFERLCQRLLREAGFQEVVVTGRTGDGGIDGKGLLQINPLLSIQVVFQSKRYSANTSITAGQIRDLRGAMAGRTDRGIFITTSSFTADARKEAFREGVPPIELVDAEKLVDMFARLELGLIPRTAYEVDQHFFEEYRT